MHSSTGIPNNKSLNSFRFGIYVDLESKHCSQDTDMNLCECKMALLTGRLVYRQISACKNAGTLLSALPFSSWLVPVFRLPAGSFFHSLLQESIGILLSSPRR